MTAWHQTFDPSPNAIGAADDVASPGILFESHDLMVRFVPAGAGDVCVVTFDSYNDDRTLSRNGFAEGYLAAIGVAAVHVISRNNDWYQHRELPDALARIRSVTRGYGRVITYGTSMGGYAAIRFADRVGADAVIALSPQYSIDPAKAPFEKRWMADARRIKFLADLDGRIVTRADVVVAYDPASLDAKHVDLIVRDIKIRPLRVSYAGHSVPAMLNESKLLDPLIQRVIADKLDTVALEREVRHRRRELAIYFAELANRQPPHRSKLAVRLARRAAELNPHHDIALRSLADRLAADGQFEEAIVLYEGLLERNLRPVQYLLPFSRMLAASGQPDRAIEIVSEVTDRRADSVDAHAWASHLQDRQGRLDLALAHARKAVELQPGVAAYRKTAAQLKLRLGAAQRRTQFDQAVRWLTSWTGRAGPGRG